MSEKLNLYQKISAVMKDIQYLQKDDKVSTGANGSGYKAMSEEKVTQVVRESLIQHGLVILPVAQSHNREELRDKENVLKGYLSIVDTQYKIVDIETGQFELLASSGTGADTQDKGVGKAMTYSYKYLLLRTFAIPTGEDPDKISSAVLDEQHETEKRASQPKQPAAPHNPPQQDKPNPPPQTNRNAPLISEAQIKYAHKLRNDKGIGEEDFRRMVAELANGKESLKDLTKQEASSLINFLTSYAA